ncbi:hypothetical protein HDV05_007771 [Chytridiales sp. JEL 0842]|nr:hypothetical protein HDV05_007771 [Chytridiales sp. JEL 0842]
MGVKLWNESVERKLKHVNGNCSVSENLTIIASLRLAAFRLLQASYEGSPDDKTSIKILELAVKTGKAFLDSGDYRKADEMFQAASDFAERHLVQDTTVSTIQLRSLLLAYQAQTIWENSKSTVAFQLINRSLSPEFVNKSADQVADRVQWLKRGLDLVDSVTSTDKKVRTRKDEILMLLATCHFMQNNVDHAGLYIDKIDMKSITSSYVMLSLYHLKFSIMKAKNAPEASFREIYNSMINSLTLRNVSDEAVQMCMAITHILAEKSLNMGLELCDWLLAENRGIPDKEKLWESILLTRIHLLVAPESASISKDSIEKIRRLIKETSTHGLSNDVVLVAQVALWQAGDNAFEDKRYQDAIDLFKICLHLFTDKVEDVKNANILRRKIALAYIELHNFTEAEKICNDAYSNDPSSITINFVKFIVSLEQNREDAARHLHQIAEQINHPDDCNIALELLLGAADHSFRAGKITVLRTILSKVIEHSELLLRKDSNFWRPALLIMLRCIIQLTKQAYDENQSPDLIEALVGHVQTAIRALEFWKLADTVGTNFDLEVTWLYRFTWNLAIAASAGYSALACTLFSVASRALKLRMDQSKVTLRNRKICLFLVLAGELVAAREEARETASNASVHLEAAKAALRELKEVIKELERDDPKLEEDSISGQCVAFEFELILISIQRSSDECQQQKLDMLKDCLNAAAMRNAPTQIYKRMADMVMRMNVPPSVVFITVQATLEAILTKEPSMDLTSFSHWFRILVKSSLVNSRNIDLFQQALLIIKANGLPTTYPMEEIQWLQITAWNCGCEFFSANDQVNAKLWCELAIAFAEYLPENSSTVTEMRRNYADILRSGESS